MNPAFLGLRVIRRVLRLDLLAGLFLFSGSLSAAIIIQSSQGGPHQYNGGGGFASAVAFELDEAVRIQAIQVWLAGGKGDTGEVGIFYDLPRDPLSPDLSFHSFTLKGIDFSGPGPSDPGRWEGVGGFHLDLQPGLYEFVVRGPNVPWGYGGPFTPGPYPLGDTYQAYDLDEGWRPNGGPFGIRIYGTQLSAVPEPGTYGVAGGLMLLGLAAFRRRQRSRADIQHVVP
jgi:PEP-CTERM motif